MTAEAHPPEAPAPEWRESGVSVLLPTFQAARYLPGCLDSLWQQTYPGPVEIVVADGGSTDGTREIVRAAAADGHDIRLVDNPARLQGAGLNLAARAARHDLLVRCDAQSRFPVDGIARIVAEHRRADHRNVGGRQVGISPGTRFGDALAAVYNSRLGSGWAAYRRGTVRGPADTVYLGSWRRERLLESGGFSTGVGFTEDTELNLRWQRRGGEVWLVPDLDIGYVTRASARQLARQRFLHGFYRTRTAWRHRTLHWRQVAALAPVASVGLAFLAPRWPPAGLPLAGYGAAVLAAGATAPVPWHTKPLVPVVLVTMHLSWGIGFCVGVATLHRVRPRVDDAPPLVEVPVELR